MIWGRGCFVTVLICFGLKIWFMERVVMLCVRVGSVGGGIGLGMGAEEGDSSGQFGRSMGLIMG